MDIDRKKSLQIELELYKDAKERIKELLTYFEKVLQRKFKTMKNNSYDECNEDFYELFSIAELLSSAENQFEYKLTSYLYNFIYLFNFDDSNHRKYLFNLIKSDDILDIL